jgi:DNA-binding transcriptional ArsR family regulator
MTGETDFGADPARLLDVLAALDSPHRLRVIACLAEGRVYVSELARRMGMSRPLLYLHLGKLQEAGLVQGSLELSDSGRAMKWFELVPFEIRLTPELVSAAAAQLAAAAPDPEIPHDDEGEQEA